MSTDPAAARAEAIREICRAIGMPHAADTFIHGRSGITPAELRTLAGLPPPPSPTEQREIFRSLN